MCICETTLNVKTGENKLCYIVLILVVKYDIPLDHTCDTGLNRVLEYTKNIYL